MTASSRSVVTLPALEETLRSRRLLCTDGVTAPRGTPTDGAPPDGADVIINDASASVISDALGFGPTDDDCRSTLLLPTLFFSASEIDLLRLRLQPPLWRRNVLFFK